MNKKDLLHKIKDLDGLSQDERAYLVNLVNTKKKYGLVWEDKHEDVEEQLRSKLPVLKEVKERAIINDNKAFSEAEVKNSSPSEKLDGALSGAEVPNHILIEGDNLHALTALTFTHENKIDLIYIDPPYNTGNKDFIYNDHYVDKEDAYRHSKWISFMEKRLKIAHKLLKDDGVIFISIDDNEQANLVVLCNEIFGESNQVAVLPTIMNLKGNQDQFGFAGTHEYTLVYAKNRKLLKLNELPYDPEELEKWDEDEVGFFKKGANLKATGVNAPRNKRPNLYFPIFYDGNKTYVTDDDKPLNESDKVLYPITDDKEMSWRWSKSKFKNEPYNIIVIESNNGFSVYKKQRPQLGDIPSKKPKSVLYKPEYSSGNGTAQLKKLFGTKIFNNPKPLDLLMDFITISGKDKNSICLDFFAGSGTFLESILRKNKSDKGSRISISVSNNENQIAEKITYERGKRAIKLLNSGNNLRYYKTDFVDREPSLANKRQLTQLATELLCIKEDAYTAVSLTLDKIKWSKSFTDQNGKLLFVVYDDMYIEEAVSMLEESIKENKYKEVKVYVFSNGQYAYAEDFEDIAENITLAALPDAIYKAYQNVLPKENKEFVPELDDEVEEVSNKEEINLFNQN